jgi:hypothetical protein
MRGSIAVCLACASGFVLAVPLIGANAQAPPSGSLGSDVEALKKAADDYRKAVDRVLDHERGYDNTLSTTNALKQGRAPGDPVWDKAEQMRAQAWQALDEAGKARKTLEGDLGTKKTELAKAVTAREEILKTAATIGALLKTFEKADKDVEGEQQLVQELEAKHREAVTERERVTLLRDGANRRGDAVDAAVANANLVAAQTRENQLWKALQDARADLKTARSQRTEALRRLRETVKDVDGRINALGIKTSQAAPAIRSPLLRQASFLSHGHGHQSAMPVFSTEPSVVSEGMTFLPPLTSPELAPGLPIEVAPGSLPVVPDEVLMRAPGAIVSEGVDLLALPSVPFVPSLDPPVAPVPARPAHCVSREIPLDDPACSWKLEGPRTLIALLPRPGDIDLLADDSSPRTGPIAGDAATEMHLIAGGANPPQRPGAIAAPRLRTRAFVFDCPAYLPVMRFKDRRQSYEDEGVRIVEGMVLRLAADGSYEVEFQAEAIPTPATVRLQLTLMIGGRPGTVSLPPLVLDPRDYGRTDQLLPNTWHVVYRGTAPFLRYAFILPDPMITLDRDGIARIGSGVSSVPYEAR